MATLAVNRKYIVKDALWLFIKGTIPSAVRDPCSLVECPFHGNCRMINGKATCRCNLACNMSSNPVCGSDGKTYGNDCIMKSESCLSQKVIEVDYKGVCGMYFYALNLWQSRYI